MKRILLASVFAVAIAAAALAQNLVGTPAGTDKSGGINGNSFTNNSDASGFSDTSVTNGAVALATSTAQATFAPGSVLTGQVLTTRTTVITTCSSTTGFTLPAVNRFTIIKVINRSGGSCLIWPSIGATVETALGTNGAANAPFTMLTNTDVSFHPVSATSWLQ